MHVLATLAPIFAVVVLGYLARRNGFIAKAFLGPANRVVFYLALPALVFRAVSRASLKTDFSVTVLCVTLASVISIYICGWLVGKFIQWHPKRVGAFSLCGGHGNHAYVGLPIALYFIGESGLAKAAILAGFLFIVQNTLSVLAIQTSSTTMEPPGKRFRVVVQKLSTNPIIFAAFAGMAISLLGVKITGPLLRFLDILSGMAAPLSLLLIGASLSFELVRNNLSPVLGAVSMKLIVLPLLGLILFLLVGAEVDDYIPALILLATPTATVTYVMAGEMGGDSEFTAAAVSASTIGSAITYVLWLTIASFI